MVCRKTTAALRSRWTAVNSFHGSSSTVDKHWLCLNLIAPGFGMTLFLEYTSILRFCWVFIGEHFLKWLDMTNYVIEKRCRLVVSRKGIFRGRCSGFRSLTI